MLNYLKANSDKQLVGIGTSLGGNMLMKVAGEMPDFPLKLIILMNQPFDLWKCRSLQIGSIYEPFLL